MPTRPYSLKPPLHLLKRLSVYGNYRPRTLRLKTLTRNPGVLGRPRLVRLWPLRSASLLFLYFLRLSTPLLNSNSSLDGIGFRYAGTRRSNVDTPTNTPYGSILRPDGRGADANHHCRERSGPTHTGLRTRPWLKGVPESRGRPFLVPLRSHPAQSCRACLLMPSKPSAAQLSS
jgi:hypothetical protein